VRRIAVVLPLAPPCRESAVHLEIVGRKAERLQALYRNPSDCHVGPPGEAGAEAGHRAMVEGASGGLAACVGSTPAAETRVTLCVQIPHRKAAVGRAPAPGASVLPRPTTPPAGVDDRHRPRSLRQCRRPHAGERTRGASLGATVRGQPGLRPAPGSMRQVWRVYAS
jgi:hypothetical protein